jgi:hypothetical protein
LEGLPAPLVGILSDSGVPGDLGTGKDSVSLINRIKFLKIDAVTGEPVSDEDKPR